MRDLAILIFQTLDGVMQAPSSPDEDRSNGFDHGGWGQPCWQDVMHQVMHEAMNKPYDLLLGRNTYDMFAGHFSGLGDESPEASRLNTAVKYVVTANQQGLEWQNTKSISGDVIEKILQLKTQDGPLLQVHGSWQLIQELLAHHLVDEFRLWTFPVILGEGKRLFESGCLPTELRLLKTQATKSGAVMQIYRRN